MFSQLKFETFVINEKMGIVEISTLNEYIPPTYDYGKRVSLNSDYLTFREDDSLKIFDKKTGLWKNAIHLNSQSTLVFIDKRVYLHLIEDSKSVLFDSVFRPKFYLDKEYSRITYLADDMVYAEDNGMISVFKLNKKKPKILQRLDATDFTIIKQYNDDSIIDFLVFYGGKHTYFFDKDLVLKHRFEKRITYRDDLSVLVNPPKENVMVTASPSNDYAIKPNPKEYKTITSTDKKLYTSEVSLWNMKTFKDYELDSYDSKNFTVYKVFSTTDARGNTSTSMSSKHCYIFKMDAERMKALIPLKYQEEVGFEIELK